MPEPDHDPDFLALYEAYVGTADGIGGVLARLACDAAAGDPLIVATSTAFALYPGSGKSPEVLGFRSTTRGFKELAAISHLGPAVGSLVNMSRVYGAGDAWRAGAEDLRRHVRRARAANSATLWRDRIAVEAYRGREVAIAAMTDYACDLTDRLLGAVLEDETKLDPEFVRREFLEAKGDALGASVPFSAVMVATFFLVGMDIAFRTSRWLRGFGLDWGRTMALVAGQQGRPTAGVTWTSNSIAQIILAASDHSLPLRRLYIAPHAPTFSADGTDDLASVRQVEGPLRRLWSYTWAISELAPTMFLGYARYDPGCFEAPTLTPQTDRLGEMPRIEGPDDMLGLVTRLRLVLEDPRQLLSGCVTDYAAEQLRLAGGDPAKVVVPGLDGQDYRAALRDGRP